jgi:multidrug resistance efflux pump
MMCFAGASGLLRSVIVVALGAALILAAVRFSRSAAGPTASPPPEAASAATSGEGRDGVVCFGTVDLEHGVTSLGPIQPGRVVEVLVAENQEVEQGAELLRLEDAPARGRLAEAEAAVELARLQLRRVQRQPEQHRRRVAQQAAMRDAMHSRAAAARVARDRQAELAKSVVVSESDRTISAEKIQEAEALERAEEQRLAELEAEDVEDPVRRATWELKAAEARYQQARAGLEDCRVRAPRRGTVLRVLVGPGDVLGARPGQAAVLFAPDGPRVIRATVEQEFAGRVKEGKPAMVHDEANPAATWRGRVGRVAGWYGQRRVILHDPSQLSDVRTLECVIVLEPGQPRLDLGQSVRVFIGSAIR